MTVYFKWQTDENIFWKSPECLDVILGRKITWRNHMKPLESETFMIFTTTYFILERALLSTNIKSNIQKRLNISKLFHAFQLTNVQQIHSLLNSNTWQISVAKCWRLFKVRTDPRFVCIFQNCVHFWFVYGLIQAWSQRAKFSNTGEDEANGLIFDDSES